ncbi:MAG: hypothetical protein RLZZ426_329 [Actinomycetota bacterium]
MITHFWSNRRNQVGLGLVELLVYCAMFLIVLGIVGSSMISLLSVQRAVVGQATTAQNAHLIAKTMETYIPSSTAIALVTDSDGDQLVTTRTAGSSDTIDWVCLAWYFDRGSQDIRFKSSDSAITFPTTADATTWVLLGESVSGLQDNEVFSLTGGQLKVGFALESEKQSSVSIRTTITARGGSWESEPCF